jgi:protein phosphatase
MVRQGELSPEQAATHPHRHILTRALGIDPGIEIDSWVLESHSGMRILLCSDGLTNECSDTEIAAVLTEQKDLTTAAQMLVERALDHGGSDNVTVVVADVDTDDAPTDIDVRATSAHATSPSSPKAVSQAGEHERPLRSRSLYARRLPTRARTWRPTERIRPQLERSRDERILTPRVALFALALVAVLGGALGFVGWFYRASYFVGLDNGYVTIYNGRPSGLLWFKPTIAEITPLTSQNVLASSLPLLRSGILESSFANAKETVINLSSEAAILGQATSSTTTSSTVVSVSRTTVVSSTTTTSRKQGST